MQITLNFTTKSWGIDVMKILVIGKYYYPFRGGIESNTKDISEGLAKTNDIHVICFDKNYKKTEIINGVTVVRHKELLNIKSQPISFSYIKEIVSYDSDIIHLHAPNFVGVFALLMKKIFFRKKYRLIITHHMDVTGRLAFRLIFMWTYKIIVKLSDKVIVTSLKNAKNSSDISYCNKVVAIPLGLDIKNYSISQDDVASAFRWRENNFGNKRLIGFVGRHVGYKGIDVLLRAVKNIENTALVIAGDGPLKESMEKLADDLNISGRVKFVGEVSHSEKLKILSCIDVFAFPSVNKTEAFGISQVEAMLMGAPVVATELFTGVNDVAIDKETAVLAVPGDVNSLTEKLNLVLSDKNLSKKIKENAKKFVLENLSIEKTTASTVAEILK